MYAFTKVGYGLMSTLRNVVVWNLPMNLPARACHAGFVLSARIVPKPSSVKLKPAGLAVYPFRSGVLSQYHGSAMFLGMPMLLVVKSVNRGAASAAVPELAGVVA